MPQVGKLFNSVPYIVRDQECAYTDIPEVEEVINDFLSNYMLKIDNLVNVFSNNRDTQTNFHIKVNGNMPKDSIYVDYKHHNFEITFEEYKEAKTKAKTKAKIKTKYQTIQTIIFFYNLIYHLKHQLLHESLLYMLKTSRPTIQYNKDAIEALQVQSCHF